MKVKSDISIIVPTYNEKDNITPLITGIRKALKKNLMEIIVVDDNSPDKTWEVADSLKRKGIPVRVFRRVAERGLVSAIQHGIDRSRGEYVGWLDADLSHHPKYFEKMYMNIKDADVVVASRYVQGGKDERKELSAVVFSKLINVFALLILYPFFKDYTSGFILIKKNVLQSYRLRGDYGEYFIDLICHSIRRGYVVTEVPYSNTPRVAGYSKTASNVFDFLLKGRKYVYMIGKNVFKK